MMFISQFERLANQARDEPCVPIVAMDDIVGPLGGHRPQEKRCHCLTKKGKTVWQMGINSRLILKEWVTK